MFRNNRTGTTQSAAARAHAPWAHMLLLRILLVFTFLAVASNGAIPAQQATASSTGVMPYTLSFRWSLLSWPGDNIPVGDALRGSGLGTNDVYNQVTAVSGWWDPSQRWQAFFPGGENVPGANDLATLNTGYAYWIAIAGPDPLTWFIANPAAQGYANQTESLVGAAASPPSPPARFAGSILVDGVAPPAGTTVAARVGASDCGTATTFAYGAEARYVVDALALAPASSSVCGTDGAVVTFLVDGRPAAATGTWRNYRLNLVDLTVTGPAGTPVPVVVAATATSLYCFVYSGPTILASSLASTLSPAVTALHRMNLPAGNWGSWFRAAPGLATIASIQSGDMLCVVAPAGTAVGLSTPSSSPAPAATPTQVSVGTTATSLTCFAYSGPPTAAAGLATLLSTPVTALHRMNLPAGNWSSWFRAAPGLATIVSIQSGDLLCVAAPVGTAVFSAMVPPPAAPTNVQATIASWIPATCTITVDVTWQDNSNDETGFYIGPPSGPGVSAFAGFARPSANASSVQFSYSYGGGMFPVFVWAVIQTPSQLVFSTGDPSGVFLTPSPAAFCPVT